MHGHLTSTTGLAEMGKQYDRLLDRSEVKRKQGITSFHDYLWRLKVVLNRVQCLGSYRWALRQPTVGEVLKKTEKLSSDLEKWRNENPSNGEKTIQLGTLPEAVDQLEDMADDIEYTRSKQRRSMKPNQLAYLTWKLRLAFKIKNTEELLQKLLVIIQDFQKEHNSEKCSAIIINESDTGTTLDEQEACVLGSQDRKGHEPIGIAGVKDTGYTTSPISEDQSSNEITAEHDSYSENFVLGSEHLLKRLFIERGDLVIAYGVAGGTKKAIIPVDDIFHDKRVMQEFGLLLSVRASDRTMSTVSPESAPEESIILKLMNSIIVRVEGEEGCRCCSSKEGKEGWLPGNQGSSNMSQGLEVNKAHERIEEFSKGKKFLLVLDDVSKDQLPQLHCLLSALSSGNSESRIVISSQSSEVLESLRGIKISEKRNIGDSIFWYFFRSLAFGDGNSSTSQKEKGNEKEKEKGKEKERDENPEKLENMGKEMSRHLIKFPLAAKMVAKLLNSKRDYQFWDAISRKVRSVVESVDCEHCQLLSLLKTCYDELPAPLRLCFQYCSLFPNNWTFTSETLVRLWMSQGFLVKDPAKEVTLEDLGQHYFNDLHSRSFFEKITDDDHTSFYSLHKVVHSFAQVTAGEEFMRIESDIRPEESRHVRHLSVKSVNLSALRNVDAIFKLRTLIIFGPINSKASEILEKILPSLRKTRTLDLSGCGMKTFPKLTDDLRKHLRFLSIYDTGVQKLPDDFCEFLHLQFLNILGSRVKKLPKKTTRLLNLRHISGPTFLTSEMRHIGKLKALQELEDFPVSKTHRMKDLGGINDLRGSIAISNLEKVRCTAAAKARLCDKGNLNSLKLEWSSKMMQRSSICGFNTLPIKSRLSAKVLELLKPHPALKVLEINQYIGSKCPSWFTADVLQNIADIRLRNCMNWDKPPLLCDLPHLKTLKLENCDKFEGFSDQKFEVLNELSLEGMAELKYCKGSFPLLKLLTIQNCPQLKLMPLFESTELVEIYVEDVGLEILHLGNPKSLTRLTVRDCSYLSSIVVGKVDDDVYLPSLLYVQITGCHKIERLGLTASASLQVLLIKNCSLLKHLQTNNAEADFPSLRTVHVSKFSLLEPHFKGLVCLEELTIEDDKLVMLPESLLLLGVIKKLRLVNCKELEALPEMKQFSALSSLQLEHCHKISSLPFLPYSMDVLRIDDCPLLEDQCREDGPAWSRVSHVPCIYI